MGGRFNPAEWLLDDVTDDADDELAAVEREAGGLEAVERFAVGGIHVAFFGLAVVTFIAVSLLAAFTLVFAVERAWPAPLPLLFFLAPFSLIFVLRWGRLLAKAWALRAVARRARWRAEARLRSSSVATSPVAISSAVLTEEQAPVDRPADAR